MLNKLVIYPLSLRYNMWRIGARTTGMKSGSSHGRRGAESQYRHKLDEFWKLCKAAMLVADNVDIITFPEIIPNEIDYLEFAATRFVWDRIEEPDGLALFMTEKGRQQCRTQLSTDKEREDFDSILRFLFQVSLDQVLVSSPHPQLCAAALRVAPDIEPDNVLLILAASGISIRMPAIFASDPETLNAVKEKYASERLEYIAFMRGFVQECHERLSDGKYKDAYHYAQWGSTQRVKALCEQWEAAAKKSPEKLLKRIAVAVKDIGPEIVKNPTAVGVGVAVLQARCTAIIGHKFGQFDEYKDVAYVYKLKEPARESVWIDGRESRRRVTLDTSRTMETLWHISNHGLS